MSLICADTSDICMTGTRQQTARIISDRLPVLAGRFNLQYNKISIKNQQSRWASLLKKEEHAF